MTALAILPPPVEADRFGTIEVYADGKLVIAGRQTGGFELLGAEILTERGQRYRLEKVPPAWVWWWRR